MTSPSFGHMSYFDLSYLALARRLAVSSLELEDRSWDRSLDWDWRIRSRCMGSAYDEI